MQRKQCQCYCGMAGGGGVVISRQLAILRCYTLAISRRKGIHVFCSVRDPDLFKLLDAALEVFNNHLTEIRNRLEQLE